MNTTTYYGLKNLKRKNNNKQEKLSLVDIKFDLKESKILQNRRNST